MKFIPKNNAWIKAFLVVLIPFLPSFLMVHNAYGQLNRLKKASLSEKMIYQSRGVPACPDPVIVTQPDGSKITISGHGDGVVHWYTTTDGYTVDRNKKGYFEYAKKDHFNNLVLSGIKASDPGKRRLKSANLLKSIEKGIRFSALQVKAKLKSHSLTTSQTTEKNGFPVTGNPRLPVILVNFADAANTYSKNDFENYMNQDNYNATGSVKQYFHEISYGQLSLQIDVYGWVTASKSHDYYGENDTIDNNDFDKHPRELVMEAIQAVDDVVDFSQYDNNGDGKVDGISIIHQGTGEEIGLNELDIWSHSWSLSGLYSKFERTFDGVEVDSYTIQPEKRNNSEMNTIGVMCHEFAHNLGAPDFYDTDYEESGGKFEGTGVWDLMASGTYRGTPSGASPAHPNMFIKYFYYNWLSPLELTSQGTFSLENSAINPQAYFIRTQTDNEFFLLENRQQIGFDQGLPGHGLLIYHVDGDHISLHDKNNDINVSSHQGLYIKDAGNNGTINDADCPYPSGENTSFTDVSTPNSLSWNGAFSNSPITNIREDNGVVTFDFLSGIPFNFEANAVGVSEIIISWMLDNFSDPVLLAWNSSSEIGEPVQGTSYAPGDEIPGGGTVLYTGKDTIFQHKPLIPGTQYFYKIWSKRSGNKYSSGIIESEKTTNVIMLSEDFESHPDFSKKISGWTMHDVDNSTTYGISGVTYPGSGSKMAYMVFNPSETTPPAGTDWNAFEGQKQAACFASTSPPNNDWLISPKINVGANTLFSFYAKSVTDQWGLERFKVLVSTTGTDISDFIKISEGDYLEAPINWTRYQFDLSAYLGQNIYLAVQCVSDDAFCFLLDDFEVTSSGPSIANWNGLLNNDWNNPGNWDIDPPTLFSDVTVPDSLANYPRINDDAYCNNLTIEDEANVTVVPGGMLYVEYSIANHAGKNGLIIFSKNDSSGQLINDTHGVELTVQKLLSGRGNYKLSSPVSDTQSEVFTSFYDALFNESSGVGGDWESIENTTTPLVPGKGYWVENTNSADDTIRFAGTLNKGNISVPLGYSGEENGWNFIGNPYISTIDWSNTSIEKTNVNNAIYLWNDTLNGGKGQYISYNNGISSPEIPNGSSHNIISPLQGFFVRANAPSANVTFSKSAQVPFSNFRKIGEVLPMIIRLSVKDSAGNGDETVIRKDLGATTAFDSNFDAYKRFHPNPEFPELFSLDENNHQLSINCIPDINENSTFAICLRSSKDDVYEIKLAHPIENWDSSLPVFLVDTRTYNVTNLLEDNFTLIASTGEEVQLQLVFTDISVDLSEKKEHDLQISANKNSLIVSTGETTNSTLELYDLLGRKVFFKEISGNFARVETNLAGVFVARLSTINECISKKVILYR